MGRRLSYWLLRCRCPPTPPPAEEAAEVEVAPKRREALRQVEHLRLLVEEAGGRCVLLARRGEGNDERFDVVFGKATVVDWVLNAIGGVA